MALVISFAGFAVVFAAIYTGWQAWDAWQGRDGRRVLARTGIMGEPDPALQAPPAAPVIGRRVLAKLFMASSPARPEWAGRWQAPALLAGALLGGLGGYELMRVLHSQHVAAGAVAGVLAGAVFGAGLWRRWRQQWWTKEISHGLIDLLDLWILCLDAGMSFQAALARAAQDNQLARPLLRRELALTHQEMMAGLPSEEALRNLVKRCRGATELSALVSHIIQSEKLGGSIAKTLQVYANSLRFNRYQDMKESVQKMPAKLAFPLVFCILPCLLIVIAGPAMLRLHDVLSR